MRLRELAFFILLAPTLCISCTDHPGSPESQCDLPPGWSQQNSLPSPDDFHDVVLFKSDHGIAVGSNGAILRMTDGCTWTLQESGVNNLLERIAFLDARTVFVVGREGTILRSNDKGVTWSQVIIGVDALLSGIHFSDHQVGLIVGNGGTILRSSDHGESWLKQESGTTVWLRDVCFINSHLAVAVGQGVLLISNDAGLTWHKDENLQPGDLWDVSSYDSKSIVVVGMFRAEAVAISTDLGKSWQQSLPWPHIGPAYAASFINSHIGTVVGADGHIYHTVTGGSSWTHQGQVRGYLAGVAFSDLNTGVAVGSRGKVLMTQNGGVAEGLTFRENVRNALPN